VSSHHLLMPKMEVEIFGKKISEKREVKRRRRRR
jgi:hypothetical protein